MLGNEGVRKQASPILRIRDAERYDCTPPNSLAVVFLINEPPYLGEARTISGVVTVQSLD